MSETGGVKQELEVMLSPDQDEDNISWLAQMEQCGQVISLQDLSICKA